MAGIEVGIWVWVRLSFQVLLEAFGIMSFKSILQFPGIFRLVIKSAMSGCPITFEETLTTTIVDLTIECLSFMDQWGKQI